MAAHRDGIDRSIVRPRTSSVFLPSLRALRELRGEYDLGFIEKTWNRIDHEGHEDHEGMQTVFSRSSQVCRPSLESYEPDDVSRFQFRPRETMYRTIRANSFECSGKKRNAPANQLWDGRPPGTLPLRLNISKRIRLGPGPAHSPGSANGARFRRFQLARLDEPGPRQYRSPRCPGRRVTGWRQRS